MKKCCTTNDKEMKTMPSIELIEYEKITYIKRMEDYLQSLKSMKETEARAVSYQNLLKSQIIQENGEFTKHYNFTGAAVQMKE